MWRGGAYSLGGSGGYEAEEPGGDEEGYVGTVCSLGRRSAAKTAVAVKCSNTFAPLVKEKEEEEEEEEENCLQPVVPTKEEEEQDAGRKDGEDEQGMAKGRWRKGRRKGVGDRGFQGGGKEQEGTVGGNGWRKTRHRKVGKGVVGMLKARTNGSINTVGEQEWEEVQLYVDSGATDTVVPEDSLVTVETVDGAARKAGVEYETADGGWLQNLGEKRFGAVSEEGVNKKLVAQVCGVSKALLSVSRVVKAGDKIVFDDGDSYIEDKASGERIRIQEDGGMYAVKMWVRNGGKGF